MDIQQNLSYMIDEYEETHDEDAEAFVLDKATIEKLLEESNVPEEKINRIEKGVDEAFGTKPPIAENVIDAKALEQNVVRIEKQELQSQVSTLSNQLNEKDAKLQEFSQQLHEKDAALQERTTQLMEKQEEIENFKAETKNYDVVLHVKPEKANQIHSSIINGQKCLVIPMNENEQATINGVNATV